MAEANDRGYGNDDRDNVLTSTTSIGGLRSRTFVGEEHAKRNEQVCDYLGVGGQHICQENVPKFPIAGLSDCSNRNTPENGKKTKSSRRGEASDWKGEDEKEVDEVGDGEEVVVDY